MSDTLLKPPTEDRNQYFIYKLSFTNISSRCIPMREQTVHLSDFALIIHNGKSVTSLFVSMNPKGMLICSLLGLG